MQIIYANIKRCSLQDVPKIVPLSLSKALFGNSVLNSKSSLLVSIPLFLIRNINFD